MSKRPIPRWRVQLIREAQEAYEHLTSPEAVAEHFAFLRAETVETFYVAFVDTKNRIIGMQEVCRGTVDRTIIHPRHIFQAAILANCTSIILVHAHLSGDPTPSDEDQAITEQLVQAGELLGIEVLDHVIIGDPGSYSFREAGELNPTHQIDEE